MSALAKRTRPLLAAALLVLIAALTIAGCGDDGDESKGINADVAAANDGKPRIIEVKDIAGAEAALGHPIYWAGEQSGKSLELTITQPGNAFIRYLNSESELGSPNPDFLTIGTYPLKGAYDALQKNAKNHPGTRTAQAPDSGFVLVSKDRPQSVYIAYSDKPDIQIEVYSPSASQAFELATSGDIKPVGD